MSIYYVYAYLRSKSTKNGQIGSPYYIGKGKGNRAYDTAGHKLPKDKSNIVILYKDLTEAVAHQLEIWLIEMYGRIDMGTGCLWNRTDGGEGASGAIRSVETRAKMSAARQNMSAETRAKMIAAQKSYTPSAETKAKLSAAHKGRKVSAETKAKLSAAKQNMSVETKAKMSAAHKGRKVSAETRAKISAAKKGNQCRNGFKNSVETKAKMSAAHQNISAETKAKLSASAKAYWKAKRLNYANTSTINLPQL